VRGRVVAHATSTIPTLESVSSLPPTADRTVVSDPSKSRILGSRPKVALPHSTMIGELKLTALKQRLASVNIHAELIGEGVLICKGNRQNDNVDVLEETVAVRKKAKGSVELEGNVSELYYKVRREIYNLHAMVAAS
jgi:cleavage and polyadenylation specificity factor subunit 2